MKLIQVSENVLVNTDLISAVEQKMVGKKAVYTVVAGSRVYNITIPIEKF